ncbi:MAG: type II toxin-antitoxin system VapC family toxin, partial [Candidatus Hydrogenedentes bacterium]|nr:type II toxin-antitoxin system VapC family toxin [Candidatus Hydrogenedentota bacterium]
MKRAIRVYADTSVFGGVFDAEFAVASRAFIELVGRGRFVLVVSPLVGDEVASAPRLVQDMFRRLRDGADHIEVTPEVTVLQRAYLRARIVAPRWEADALHVALATVARCAVIVSWNFKHIVN